MKNIAIASAVATFGLLGINANNARADNVDWGLSGLNVCREFRTILAGGSILRTPNDKADCCNEIAGFFMADLSR